MIQAMSVNITVNVHSNVGTYICPHIAVFKHLPAYHVRTGLWLTQELTYSDRRALAWVQLPSLYL